MVGFLVGVAALVGITALWVTARPTGSDDQTGAQRADDPSVLHVSATSGLADGDGTEERPFATINACGGAARGGDTCAISDGVYRETVEVTASGDPEAPIRFVADGDVLITGLDVVPRAEFRQTPAGRFAAATSTTPLAVFVDGNEQSVARWPNLVSDDPFSPDVAQFDLVDLVGDGCWKISDDALEAGVDVAGFTDAQIWFLSGWRWVSANRPITANEDGTFTIEDYEQPDTVWEALANSPAPNDPYFLFGDPALADVAGEWFWDDDAGEIQIVAPDAADLGEVEVRTRTCGINVDGSANVRFEGIRLEAAAVRLDGENLTIDGCRSQFATEFRGGQRFAAPEPGGDAIEVSGRNITVTNCEIADPGVARSLTQDTSKRRGPELSMARQAAPAAGYISWAGSELGSCRWAAGGELRRLEARDLLVCTSGWVVAVQRVCEGPVPDGPPSSEFFNVLASSPVVYMDFPAARPVRCHTPCLR